MTYDHIPPYAGNKNTNVLFIILAYSFVQKFRSCIFLTVLLTRLLPLTLGFTCGSLNSTLSPPKPSNQAAYNAPGQQDPINAHIEQPITSATLDTRRYYTPNYPYSYKTPPLDARKKAIPGNKIIPDNDAAASSDLGTNTLQSAIPWPNSTAYWTISLSKTKIAPPTKPVLCLKQSEPLNAWQTSPSLPDKYDGATKNKAIYHQPTSLQSEPKSLWEELQDADDDFFSQAFLHNNDLAQPLEGSTLANMQQEADALSKALNSVKEFEISQKKLQDSISNTSILLSNNGLSKAIKLVNNDEIQLPLSSAIEAISALQAVLKEENAQPRITESGLASLNKKHSNVLKTLPKLQKVIDEGCTKVLFTEKSLMLLTENLSKVCDLLFGLLRVDDMDNMTEVVKKTLIRNKTQSKKVRNILKRLEDLQSSRQKMARSFRKEIWETQERLVDIQKKVTTLLKNPLKKVERKMKLLDLREVRLETNIIKRKVENPKRMESIIMGLKLGQEELEQVQTILSKIDFKSLKIKITTEITEAVKKVLALNNDFQKSVQETAESMINQTKSLQRVLTEVDPCYDSGYEEE